MPAPLFLLAATLLFSTGGVAIKATTLPALAVVGLRSAIAAAVLLVALPEARRGWSREAVVAAVPYAATMILFGTATKLTTAAHAIVLQSTAPLWLVGLGPWLLHEPVRRRDLAVLVAVLAGLVLVVLDTPAAQASAPSPRLGDGLGFLSGLTWAFTVVGLRHLARDDRAGGLPGATLLAGNVLVAAVALPLAWPVPAPTARDGALLAWLGGAQIALAYVLLGHGLRHVPALAAALLMLAEPVLNPLWVWLVHGETPGRGAIVGGVVVLAATAAHAAWTARDERDGVAAAAP